MSFLSTVAVGAEIAQLPAQRSSFVAALLAVLHASSSPFAFKTEKELIFGSLFQLLLPVLPVAVAVRLR